MRSLTFAGLLACAVAAPGRGQAPDAGPLSLLLPGSTRAAALGNAGVTGRDDDVVFYNPAQLVGVRGGFSVTLARYSSRSTLGEVTSSFTGGPLSLGWGVQVVDYTAAPTEPYPFAQEVLTRKGIAAAQTMLGVLGAAMTYKGFKIGAAAKYAEDRVESGGNLTSQARGAHGSVLADAGVSHPLWQGVAGLSVQNFGRPSGVTGNRTGLPTQMLLGWTRGFQVGEFDLGLATQVTARNGYVSPGAGAELGYSWIEGYNVVARLGARQPESPSEHPVAIGGSFSADRFQLDYALQFFDGGRNAHRFTIRWR